jgi:hypothetical protein
VLLKKIVRENDSDEEEERVVQIKRERRWLKRGVREDGSDV